MDHKFKEFFCEKDDDTVLFPLVILTNTNPIPNGKNGVNYIFFLSKKVIKKLTFYYFYFSLNDSVTNERIEDKFDIATEKSLNNIFIAIKSFVNSLKDKEINIYSFSECKMDHETSQKLLDKIIKKELV